MSASTRPIQRQPAGIPTGGQFAAAARRRSGVALDERDFADLSDAVGDGEVVSEREAAMVLDQAHISGAFWARRFGTDDADEAASRALLAYFEARARSRDTDPVDTGEQATVDATGRDKHAPANVRAYVHTAVMSQTILALGERTGTRRRSADTRARREFDQRANEKAVELRRGLTDAEADEIAAEIRASFPENSRPRSDFHRNKANRVWSYDVDATVTGHGKTGRLVDTIEDDPEATRNVQTDTVPGSYRDQAEQVMAAGGRGAQLSARSLAWQVMAEKLGAPQPVRSSISEYAAASTRKVIRAGGGALAVSRRTRDGQASDTETKALFKPFGDIGDAEQEAVLNVITSHPGYGDDLWDASVLAATRLIERKH